MQQSLSDTDRKAERIQLELLAAAPEWHRGQLMFDMIETVRALVFAGVRERYPQADETEVRRRAADILLGEDLAARAYGPLAPDAEGSI